jgi:hypothetical protein
LLLAFAVSAFVRDADDNARMMSLERSSKIGALLVHYKPANQVIQRKSERRKLLKTNERV